MFDDFDSQIQSDEFIREYEEYLKILNDNWIEPNYQENGAIAELV